MSENACLNRSDLQSIMFSLHVTIKNGRFWVNNEFPATLQDLEGLKMLVLNFYRASIIAE